FGVQEVPIGRLMNKFRARVIQKLQLTVFGPKRALHSGHYGNWSPNPAMMLSQLLASMKDADGHVLVENFYDGAVPLNAIELKTIAEASSDEVQKKELGLARVDGGGKS